MNLTSFLEFIEAESFDWAVKRLSGNDTGITGGHQVGLYLPKEFFEKRFPEICTTEALNPKSVFREVRFPQLDLAVDGVTATYYNNRFFGGTRNEFRLTRWGGRSNPLQSPENTGAIIVLAFKDGSARVWVADNLEEEDQIESWLGGPVEPKQVVLSWLKNEAAACGLSLPEEWSNAFPSGTEIFQFVERALPYTAGTSVDQLLMNRREFEFSVFKAVERLYVLPLIEKEFSDVELFLKIANSVTNRRKSRSGKSLELGLESIFRAKHLEFDAQATTERKSQPDFLFPSLTRYRAASSGIPELVMLAAKTCCKDRWRQVLREAEKIPTKHLFTLQEGVSESQIAEMKDAGVRLVVPQGNVNAFPRAERRWLMNLNSFCEFIGDVQKNG